MLESADRKQYQVANNEFRRPTTALSALHFSANPKPGTSVGEPFPRFRLNSRKVIIAKVGRCPKRSACYLPTPPQQVFKDFVRNNDRVAQEPPHSGRFLAFTK